jgi:hypothetical protein
MWIEFLWLSESGCVYLCHRHKLSAWRNTLSPSVSQEETAGRQCISICLQEEKQMLHGGNGFCSREVLQTQLEISNRARFRSVQNRSLILYAAFQCHIFVRFLTWYFTGNISILSSCNLISNFKDWRLLKNAVVILGSVRRLLDTVNVPNSPIIITHMKKALRSSETSLLTRATRHNNLEYGILHSYLR